MDYLEVSTFCCSKFEKNSNVIFNTINSPEYLLGPLSRDLYNQPFL